MRNDLELCDFCTCEANESYFTGKGYLACKDCADNMRLCEYCNEYREDDEFLHGQEACDVCVEKKADMLQED